MLKNRNNVSVFYFTVSVDFVKVFFLTYECELIFSPLDLCIVVAIVMKLIINEVKTSCLFRFWISDCLCFLIWQR